jgi:hypothetical protein
LVYDLVVQHVLIYDLDLGYTCDYQL